MRKKRNKKQILFIVIIGAVALVLLSMVAGFIFSSKYAGKISRIFLDLNPFKPEQEPEGTGEGELGTLSPLNATTGGGGTTPAAGTSAEAEEVTYGTGKLEIINWISDYEFGKGYHASFHWSGGTDGLDYYDAYYSTFFSPSGKATKIISNITGYELRVDTRSLTSTSTVYLELSLHTQSGSSVTFSNVTNELRLSIDPNNKGWDFASKTLTIQQYDPNNTSASYTSYDVRDVIDDGGVITLARLDGSYDSEVPYAYFRVGFS